MRFLPALLAKLWPPAPLLPADIMDHVETDAASDPISCALDVAVGEHERTAVSAQDKYRAAIDELLERIGRPI